MRTRLWTATTDEESVLTTVQYMQKDGFKNITVADCRGKKKNGRAGGKFEWSGLNEKANTGGFSTDSLLDDGVAEAGQAVNSEMTIIDARRVLCKDHLHRAGESSRSAGTWFFGKRLACLS